MKKITTNRLLIYLGGLAVVLVILAVVGKKQGWFGEGKSTEIQVTEISKGTIIEKVSASGKVQPEVEIKVSPEVSGEIIELNIKEGDSVKRDEVLIKIRPDNYVFAVDQAQANANNAKARLSQSEANLAQSQARFYQAEQNFKRSKELYDEKVLSVQEYEQSEADYKVAKENLQADKKNVEAARYTWENAQAGVKNARENLRKTGIVAPEDGIISKLSVEKGERVLGTSQMMGTEMFRMADLSNMEVRVDVNENDIIRISLGDTAEIEVDAYTAREEKFLGVVTLIANSPTVEQTNSSDAITEFEVRIKILNSSYEHLVNDKNPFPFKPGMTASVDIFTDRKSDIVVAPLISVTTRDINQTKKKRGRRNRRDDESKDEEEEESKNAGPVKKEQIEEVVFVFVSDNSSVKMAQVKTGISDFDHIEILEGLQEGDKIVSGPYLAISKKLEDGDRVILENDQEGEGRRGRRGGSSND